MLKLTPGTITAAIVIYFLFLIGAQHLTYYMMLFGRGSEEHYLSEQLQDRFEVLTWIERLDYDIHLRARPKAVPNPNVLIVDVNERSLQELGQFPFSRKIYSTLLDRLEAGGAKVVAFDITFPERERNGAIEELIQLNEEIVGKFGFDSQASRLVQEKIHSIDADEELGLRLSRTKVPVVLGFTFSDEDGAPAKGQFEAMGRHLIKRVQMDESFLLLMKSASIPVLPHLDMMHSLNQNSSIGFFTAAPDSDSVIRKLPGILYYQGAVLMSLAIKATAIYLGVKPVLTMEEGLVIRDEESSGRLRIPLLPSGALLLNFYGDKHTFPFVEFSDVMKGRLPPETFKDKIVFVGVSAVGLKDIRATPYSTNYPGVETHATVASNILNHQFIEKDSRFYWVGYLFIVFGCVVSALAVYRLHPLLAFFVVAACIALVQVATQLRFYNQGVAVPSLVPSLACCATFFAGIVYRYFSEEREKKIVRTAFSRYVSGAVVEEILKDHTKLRLGGQKKELTVMFVDLKSFTRFSERMDAAFVTQLLNEYFTRMTRLILKNKGTLDKYMGDGIMCFWGAPLDIPDHARLACKTALEMLAELQLINEEWQIKHGIRIDFRIGLHTGDMAVGNMGSEQVFSYTVMGDNVNLGSRLEGVNAVYGTNVVVSAATAARAGAEFLYRPLDCVQVKGREDSVEILELVSERQEQEPEWVHAFRVALDHYRKSEWELASASFQVCLQLKPEDGPSQVFLERISHFQSAPPANWTGLWKLNSK